MRIAITDNYRPKPYFDNYVNWIHRVDPTVEFVQLSYHLNNAQLLKETDALVLTGGGNVHPKYYGKSELIEQAEEVNELRDEFEFGVIEKALENDMPILAICRGMQVLNVALEGSLIIDLPSAEYAFHAVEDRKEYRHPITKVPHSFAEYFVLAVHDHRRREEATEPWGVVHHRTFTQSRNGVMKQWRSQ